MRLPRRIQVLLAGFLTIVTLATGLDVAILRTRDRTSDELRDMIAPARLELAGLLTALLDQEVGQRGYLLTGDEAFLEPYETGRVATDTGLDRLRSLLADHDDLAAGVQRIRSRIGAWEDLGAEFEIAARRQGRDEVVEALVSTGTSMRLFDLARTEIDALQDELGTEAMAHQRDVERLDDILVVVDLATLLFALVLLAGTATLARRWFTLPLDALTRSVQDVADGALQSTVSAVGPPELAELAADVDRMRRRILAEVEEAERAREALADRGMVVLTLREELAAAAPITLPSGVRLAGRFAPAQGIVAGDWFDVVRLDDDRVAIALVDVSGHGAGVGAFALRTKTLTLAAVQSQEPGAALRWVADRLGDTGEQFLTGVVVVLDAQSGTVRYANAGHPPLLLAGLTGVVQLGPTGPLLGPLGATWTTEEADLPRGGALVAFSDGLIEARDDDRVPFGLERLVEIVESTQLAGPDVVADACLAAVQQHQTTREDDLTLVVVSR